LSDDFDGTVLNPNGVEIDLPCIILDGLTETQKKAYLIADNKLALNAGWNEELLRAELLDLKSLDFDLDLLGFDPEEMADITLGPDIEQPEYDEGIRQIGNCVPPLFMKAIAKHIRWNFLISKSPAQLSAILNTNHLNCLLTPPRL
jgi:hypothetical protein